MNAKRARVLAEDAVSKRLPAIIKYIDGKIDYMVKEGGFSVAIYTRDLKYYQTKGYHERVLDYLLSEGFSVGVEESRHDFRVLEISW